MPEMDGYEVCRRLKSDPRTRHVPVIFVTSQSADEDERAGFEAGGVDYLVKPISPPVVLARVRTHLSLVRAAQLEASYKEAISMLAMAGEYRDSDTGVHIWRMETVDACDAVTDRQHGAGLGDVDLAIVVLDLALQDVGDLTGLDVHQ
jgi:putative two-component system response regulator